MMKIFIGISRKRIPIPTGINRHRRRLRSVVRAEAEPRECPTMPESEGSQTFRHGSPDHHTGEHGQINPLARSGRIAFGSTIGQDRIVGRLSPGEPARPVCARRGLRSLPTGLFIRTHLRDPTAGNLLPVRHSLRHPGRVQAPGR